MEHLFLPLCFTTHNEIEELVHAIDVNPLPLFEVFVLSASVIIERILGNTNPSSNLHALSVLVCDGGNLEHLKPLLELERHLVFVDMVVAGGGCVDSGLLDFFLRHAVDGELPLGKGVSGYAYGGELVVSGFECIGELAWLVAILCHAYAVGSRWGKEGGRARIVSRDCADNVVSVVD